MKNYQVLLIEPDFILGNIYKDHLEKFHYNVVLCNNVQIAVNEVDINKPDIIILEIQNSSHNGIEFLYELRSYPEWQDIPVIIHSMLSEDSLKFNEIIKKELGIVSCLYKPNSSLGKLHYELNKLLIVNKI